MARQLGFEVDRLRALDVREVLPAIGDQGLLELGAGVAHVARLHHRFDLLAELLVGHAQHCAVSHLRVVDQHVLGLLRVDVHPARDDHVGLAVGQVQVTLGVDIADITERGPAQRMGRARSLGRIVVVLEGPAIGEVDRAALTLRQQRARLVVADLQLADHRATDRALVGQPLRRVRYRHAVALGAGVVLPDHRAPPGDHLLLDRHRARRGGVDRAAQRRQVVLLARGLGQLEHANKHRRHELAVGDAVALDQPQVLLGVEMLHHHHRATQALHAQSEAQRRSVVQRRGRQVDRARVHAVELGHGVGHRTGGVDLGELRRHEHALGPTGGAARVQHVAAGAFVGDAGDGLRVDSRLVG